MSHAYGQILWERYSLRDKLTQQDEEVYKAVDMTNNERVAIKIENKYAWEKQMEIEREIYKELTDGKCVPRIHEYLLILY